MRLSPHLKWPSASGNFVEVMNKISGGEWAGFGAGDDAFAAAQCVSDDGADLSQYGCGDFSESLRGGNEPGVDGIHGLREAGGGHGDDGAWGCDAGGVWEDY